MIVSAIFWAWAIANIIRSGGFDLGAVSFLFPLVAGFDGFKSTNQNRDGRVRIRLATYHFYLTAFGHLFVAVNYLLGAIITDGVYRLYCIIFTALWAITGFIFSFWAYQ